MTITVPPRPFSNMAGFAADEPAPETPVLVSRASPLDCFGVASSVFVLGVEDRYQAVTDPGTVIPLVRYEAVITPDSTGSRRFDPTKDLSGFLSMLEEQFLTRIKAPDCSLQRVHEINPACNCHGWTFTGGSFGIQDKHLPLILRDHGYEMVSQPRPCDVVIYSADGRMVHSGLVRLTVPGSQILVESKWGPFGVFVHAAEAHPGEFSFYRSARLGNTLKLQPIR